MYSKIANPKTGRMISVNSKLGQEILRNYLNVLEGGGVRGRPPAALRRLYADGGKKSPASAKTS